MLGSLSHWIVCQGIGTYSYSESIFPAIDLPRHYDEPERKDPVAERPTYQEALRRTDLLEILAPFDPHTVGTLPLGAARSGSDTDIVCCAIDRSVTATLLWEHFGDADGFAIYQWLAKGRPLIARF